MKIVDTCCDLAFIDIKVYAGSLAKLVHKVKKDDHVLHRAVDESSVIRVPLASEL